MDSSEYNSLLNPSNELQSVTFHYGIPSINDWRAIKSNLYIINQRLNQIGGTQISTGTKYWTSTPYNTISQWHYTPSGNDGSFMLSALTTCGESCGMYEDNTTNPQRKVRCIYSVYGSSYNPVNDYEEDIQLPEFP